MNNPLRNFNYLIGCEETKAIALDPLDGDAMVAWQKSRVTPSNILLIRTSIMIMSRVILRLWRPRARNYCAQNAIAKIPNVDRGVIAGDLIELGSLRSRLLLLVIRRYIYAYLLKPRTTAERRSFFLVIRYLMPAPVTAEMVVMLTKCTIHLCHS